ncbi:hypothetical protein SAMN05192573_108128 [Mucilaginibacter gossypii]|uniref:Uncharacterized protein n=1 Tax=Mucilaginibacter gossypii TaxID=551996 RepID=A0A1G8B9M3_9SPHI|nr:hypothetical protein SAMN05192573_108128 [Mucilaginibacter gossypii]
MLLVKSTIEISNPVGIENRTKEIKGFNDNWGKESRIFVA